MSKISNLSPKDVFFQALNAPYPVFGDRTPLGELTMISTPSRLLGRGTPLPWLPIPFPLYVFGVSISAPRFVGPSEKNSWLRL